MRKPAAPKVEGASSSRSGKQQQNAPATLKPTLTPKLRFPEFQDAGEWTAVPLGTLLSREPEYGVSEPAVPYSEHLPTYLRITDIDDDGRFISETKTSVGIDATDEQCLCTGDIALARTGASVGKSYLHRAGGERLVFAGFLIRIRPNPEVLTPSFLSSFLSTSRYWDWVRVTSTRSGQPGLNGSEYASLQVPIPPEGKDGLLEQHRIASCLSSLDDLIAAERQKLDALKAHKNGLMQQLFPRVEGASSSRSGMREQDAPATVETRPRLRFPEFRKAGEWEERIVDQLVDIQSGGTPSKANPEYWNGSVPWVTAKDMKRQFLEDSEDHISAAAIRDGARLVPPSTLLMLTRGMTLPKDIPVCVLRREMSFNQDVKALRSNGAVDSLFLAWMLRSSKQRLLTMVDIAGHGTGKLDTDELKAFDLMLPPTLAEQHRIASCLSSLDDLIAAHADKLEALKTHKKGLMQQLFPAVDGGEG